MKSAFDVIEVFSSAFVLRSSYFRGRFTFQPGDTADNILLFVSIPLLNLGLIAALRKLFATPNASRRTPSAAREARPR